MSTSPRLFPPPCWTREQTLALIRAYCDKWYSLNRGSLRSSDWDAVAVSVAADPSSSDPPKSSVQCRHKIEKIRKRYRTEKQRSVRYAGRFNSSWDLFPLLDSMEIGSIGCRKADKGDDFGDGFRVKGLVDRCWEQDLDPPNLACRARKLSRADGGFDGCGDLSGGFGLKPSVDGYSSVSVAFMPSGKFNPNVDFDGDYGGRFAASVGRKYGDGEDDSFVAQGGILKAYGKGNGDLGYNGWSSGVIANGYGGFPVKTLGEREEMHLGFRPSFLREIDDSCLSAMGFGQKNYGDNDEFLKPDVGSNVVNGNNVNKVLVNGSGGQGNKGMDLFAGVVSSIEMFTESFVKVEKMKMETAMEMENKRMKTELQHNQMILESQRQIVDVFAKAMSQKKKIKKKKVEAVSPFSNDINDSQVAATDCESIGKSSIIKDEGGDGHT